MSATRGRPRVRRRPAPTPDETVRINEIWNTGFDQWPNDLRSHIARTVPARNDDVQVRRGVATWVVGQRLPGGRR